MENDLDLFIRKVAPLSPEFLGTLGAREMTGGSPQGVARVQPRSMHVRHVAVVGARKPVSEMSDIERTILIQSKHHGK